MCRGGTWYSKGDANLLVPFGQSREVLAGNQMLKNQSCNLANQARMQMPMQRQRLQNEQPLMQI
jgi:hypothetical protein